MITKNMISNYKKDTFDFLDRGTLIERIRRIRALNASPSDIGITQYSWKTFVIAKPSRRKDAKNK